MTDDVQSMTDTELYWRYREAREEDEDLPSLKSDRVQDLETEMVKRWCERMEMNRNV